MLLRKRKARIAPIGRRKEHKYSKVLPPSGTPVPPPIPVPGPPPVPPAQVLEMVLLSIVTAPFRAMTLPHKSFAPVSMVTLVSAIIFPTNDVVVPRVAELPTCQNTLSLELALAIVTLDALAVVSVLPI